ncbi:DUF2776 family protein [Streptomyces sp. NPDC127117]
MAEGRQPSLPILTALTCLFLAAFVVQPVVVDSSVFIAAWALVSWESC